jgi:hypothetical protein
MRWLGSHFPMNTKYKSNPELIAQLRTVDPDGADSHIGDRVAGIQVQQDKNNVAGLVQIDVHDFKRNENLVIEIELPELMAALSLATLNAERSA